MIIDVQFNQGACPWSALSEATLVAEQSGFDTVWVLDHFSGALFGSDSMKECFTTLGALAAVTCSVNIGALVANVANRSGGLLALAAASVQEISDGRFLLGIGAGSSRDSVFAAEQHVLGHAIEPVMARRHDRVTQTIELLDEMWAHPRDAKFVGFAQTLTPIPVVIGVNSSALARLAGKHSDGVNVWARHAKRTEILATARQAAGNRPDFIMSVWAKWDDALLDPSHPERMQWHDDGVNRLVLQHSGAPDVKALAAAAQFLK
ncbi:MAG: LLM class flavin-dependent oxidoreductase [Ilumatobacteraceae bacterium]|nr:LLM class flavin-dependent oxidoreductase [Ilumatobacteraceae bacterium]